VGTRQGGYVEIVRGLERGDEVVVEGNYQLRSKLLEAAVQHAVAMHKHQDTPELRAQLRKLFKSEAMAA
jgi:metal-responsive CopG/Arc/MetJ family transcriptional regulator